MLQAVIFDFDGTLFPTSLRQEKWFKYYSDLHSKPWQFENFADFLYFYNSQCAKEGGVNNVYKTLDLPCDMNDRNHPVWPAYTSFNQQNPLEPFSGMTTVVKTLFETGVVPKSGNAYRRVRFGINTTNSRDSIYRDLKQSGMLPYFDSIICEETLREYDGNGNGDLLKKPSKISLALMLGLLDSDGHKTLHIGDTRNDLRASRKVRRLNRSHPENIITVGACYGYEGRTVLAQGDGAGDYFDHLIDKPEELVSIVQRLME